MVRPMFNLRRALRGWLKPSYVVIQYTSSEIDVRTKLPFQWRNIISRDSVAETLAEPMPGVRREVREYGGQ